MKGVFMKFYESLFILKRSYDNVVDIGELMWDYKLISADFVSEDHKRAVHYLALFNHSLLEICSFLEEYTKHLHKRSEDQFKGRIEEFKNAAQPIMDEIDKWKDLRNYRNEMIAHPWRIRRKDYEFSYPYLLTYDVPKSYTQLQYCRFYIGIIVNLMELEFKDELALMYPYIMKMEHKVVKQKIYLTPAEDMENAIIAANKILKKQKKTYSIDSTTFIGKMNDINPNHR
jgi:hypothetical protein